mmetsp:Transcript_4913/g.12710  ORF Transcript_4913/g.12710 Transcript_4913/m.12710 type:complete len:329 (+) Transcript_4913:217-1203(+)
MPVAGKVESKRYSIASIRVHGAVIFHLVNEPRRKQHKEARLHLDGVRRVKGGKGRHVARNVARVLRWRPLAVHIAEDFVLPAGIVEADPTRPTGHPRVEDARDGRRKMRVRRVRRRRAVHRGPRIYPAGGSSLPRHRRSHPVADQEVSRCSAKASLHLLVRLELGEPMPAVDLIVEEVVVELSGVLSDTVLCNKLFVFCRRCGGEVVGQLGATPSELPPHHYGRKGSGNHRGAKLGWRSHLLRHFGLAQAMLAQSTALEHGFDLGLEAGEPWGCHGPCIFLGKRGGGRGDGGARVLDTDVLSSGTAVRRKRDGCAVEVVFRERRNDHL